MPKTAIEKRDSTPPAKVEIVTTSRHANYPTGRMLISSPRDIDAVVRRIRKGTVLRMGELRQRLARDADADYTCPLTTGIFLRIAAEAAEEERAMGRARITPWWRVVRDDGSMNERMPGGSLVHAAHLRREGVKLSVKGRGRWCVAT